MRQRHQAAAPGQLGGQAGEIEPALGGDRQEAQDDALALGELLPGHQVAVVFEHGNQDFVAAL